MIEHEERQLIESIIEFGDTVAREVMVPQPDMVVVTDSSTVTQALDLAIAHGFSRLPVSGTNDDDIVGLAYTKDLIRAERDGRGGIAVLELARPVRFIPENKPVSRLMREMQAGKFHLAIVVDEYGGIAGLITLEDCLEELVGEIVDEYDTEEATVERLPNGDYLVDGGTSIDDLNDLLDVQLPNEDWDTIAGFVFGTLEHVPEPGEAVEFDGWRFVTEEVEGRRIRRIRIVVGARPRQRLRRRGRPTRTSDLIPRTVRLHADHAGWEGRARHRRLEGDRQGDRRLVRRRRRQGDVVVAQAGPARSGGGRDVRRDGGVRRQRR